MNNVHKVEMQLPLFPVEEIGTPGCANLQIEIDGKPVKGVSAVHVKAGENGYTNVAIELTAPTIVSMSSALVVSTQANHEYPEQVLGPIMKKAIESITDKEWLEASDLDDTGRLGLRFMELIIEELK